MTEAQPGRPACTTGKTNIHTTTLPSADMPGVSASRQLFIKTFAFLKERLSTLF